MIYEKNENEDKKQHINLSAYAMEIINSDIRAFSCETKSAFINKIFENFADSADATISQRSAEVRTELEEIFKDIQDGDKVINLLVKKVEGQLFQKAEEYPKGECLKFRVREANINRLNDEYFDLINFYHNKDDDERYFKAYKYFKALLEEYARLPYSEREAIYYADYIDQIQKAIKGNYRIKVYLKENYIFYIFPYAVLRDKMNMYNYLVGYSLSENENVKDKKACSIRISKIVKITDVKSRKSSLSKKDKQHLEKLMQNRTVQFLLDDITEKIKVQLTDRGLKLYENNFHLRPEYVEIDKENNIYTFDCTQRQIEYYFFEFGADAKIIYPQSLADKFKDMYQKAAAVYE